MFRAKKNTARQNGNRNRTQTRLHLEPLEDRWMPTVAAPVFAATAVSTSEIDLGWSSVSGANGYLVDEWINGAWQQIGSLGSASTGYSITGLSPKTKYFFDVGAYDSSGTSWANWQTSATLIIGNDTPGGFFPGTVRTAYGFNNFPTFAVNGQQVPADGTGQTIAIVDAFDDPNIQGDLANFDSTFGLQDPPSFNIIGQTGGVRPTNTAPPATNSPEFETTLDVEWAHAIAPGANILLVEANSTSTSDLDQAALTAATYPGVSVVSISYDHQPGNSDNINNPAFLSAPGVTFVSSAGDNGVFQYPWGGPGDLIVGGTQLSVNTDNSYLSENTWFNNNGSTSGGIYPNPPAGVPIAPLPSWQAAQGVAYGAANRVGPDVAYAATNFAVYDSYDYGADQSVQNSGSWTTGFGTSFGAPQWAALIAIANQGRALELPGRGPLNGLDPTLPMLYSLSPDDFHRIPASNDANGHNVFDTSGTGQYVVGCLGSPRADLIIPALVNPFHGYSSRVVDNIEPVNGAETVVGGQLVVYGNEGPAASDQIGLSYSTNAQGQQLLTVTDNGQSDSFDLTTFQSVVVNCRAAADTVTVPMTPAGYPAIDVSVEGGQGSDQLIVDDSANSDATNFTVTDTSVQRTFSGLVNFSSLYQVTIDGGSGDNNYHVQNTNPNASTEIHTGDGTDHVYVEGTQGPLTVDLGNNPLDTVELSPFSQSLDNLAGDVSVNGTAANGSGQGTLILDDQNTAILSTTFAVKSVTFTEDSAGATGSGSVTRTERVLVPHVGFVSSTLTFGFTNLANLVVNGGDVPVGGNTFNVESTPSGLTTDLYGGIGGAAFTLGATNQELFDLAGTVHVHGQGGKTSLTLNDLNRPYIAVYTLTGSTFDDGLAGRQLTYDGISTLTVDVGSKWSSTLAVQSTSASTTVTESTAPNAVTVGDANNTLNGIQGALDVTGQGDTTLTFDDKGGTPGAAPNGAYNYSLAQNSFSRTGTATVTFSGMATVNLQAANAAGSGFNDVGVASTAPGTTYQVYAGTGLNEFLVFDSGYTLNGIKGPLFLHGASGTLPNNDLVSIYDVDKVTRHTYLVNAGATSQSGVVQRFNTASGQADMAPINYDGLNAYSVLATAGSAGATIDVQSQASNLFSVIAAGSSDTVTIGNSAHTMSGILGDVRIQAVTGQTPKVTLDDASDTSPRSINMVSDTSYTYLVTGLTPQTSFGRGRIWLEDVTMPVTLKTGTAPAGTSDVFHVQDFTKAPVLTINAGNGSNTLLGPNQGATWNITGVNSGTIGPIRFSHIQNLVGGSGSDVFGLGTGGGLSGSINGGGGGDWLDYSRLPATSSVTVNLVTGTATGVGGGVSKIADVRGGQGNNTLRGNGGNILIGGGGLNVLVDAYTGSAAAGRSLLIGGSGTSNLTAGAAGDILIAGSTSFNASSGANDVALQRILAEWRSADSYLLRFQRIEGQATGGLNGTSTLVWGQTVQDNDKASVLNGGASLDWFFANFPGGDDIIHNLNNPAKEHLDNNA
jgi:hypothetical protein